MFPSSRYHLALVVSFLSALIGGEAAFAVDGVSAPEKWQAGIHYSVLAGTAQTVIVEPGKVDVHELFMYTSPASAEIQPALARWLKTKPDYIVYKRSPSIVFRHARSQAQMYYTLQALGREDLHVRFFDWVQAPERQRQYHGGRRGHPDESMLFDMNLQFAKSNGLDVKIFTDKYNSGEIDARVVQQEMDTSMFHVMGTSTFVVNGKYSTSLQRIDPEWTKRENHQWPDLFRLIEFLAEKEKSS